MRKLITLCLITTISISLVGCAAITNSKSADTTVTGTTTSTNTDTIITTTTESASTTIAPTTTAITTTLNESPFHYRTTRTDVSKDLSTVSFEEALKSLRNSEYTNNYQVTEEDMGLSDISNVGIDQDRFENEEIVTIPEDATIYLAEDYDITPDSKYNSGNLNKLLSDIKSTDGAKVVRFKGENYTFQSTISVSGISDLYLVGEDGCEFDLLSWGTYLEVKSSKNVFVKNIDFDMVYSPTIAGQIVKVNETGENPVITIEVPKEFDLTADIYNSRIKKYSSYMECVYDPQTGGYVPDRNGNLFYNTATGESRFGIGDLSYDSSTRQLSITLLKTFPWDTYKTPKTGTMVSFAYTMYDNHGFYLYNNECVTIEDVNVYVTGGMGVRIEGGKDLNLNRMNFVVKEGSSRIMTATADTIHSMALEGELNITNCTFEGSHDDALNIKSFYGQISGISKAAKELTITQTQSEIVVKFEAGDTIDIYDPDTMEKVATYTIVTSVKQGSQYTITVDKRPGDFSGYKVGNDTKSTSLSLDNCLIRNKRNRGILLQCRNSEIINCTFENVVMGAIQVLSVSDSFAEAIVPRNVTIKNTKFLNNYSDLSCFVYGDKGSDYSVPSTITELTIENNYFYNGNGNPVNLLGCGNVTIKDNLFDYTKNAATILVSVVRSDNVTVESNSAYCIMDYTFVAVDSVSENVTKKENKDIE